MELRLERSRIVVVDQFQRLTDVELCKRREYQGMTLTRRYQAQVELVVANGL